MTSYFMVCIKDYFRMSAELGWVLNWCHVDFFLILLLIFKNEWEMLGVRLFIAARNLLLPDICPK